MDNFEDFKLVNYRNHIVLVNKKGDRSCHTHLHKDSTCYLLIKLVCKKIVPDSKYLRESAKRISRDKKYIRKIEIKENKDSQKQKFFKVNNGRF